MYIVRILATSGIPVTGRMESRGRIVVAHVENALPSESLIAPLYPALLHLCEG